MPPAPLKYDVFLSYSSHDEPWVQELKKQLQARGIKIWMDKDRIRPGNLYAADLEKGLEESGAIALIITVQAMTSGWVEEEFYRALALKEKRTTPMIIIPVLLQEMQLSGFLANRQQVVFKDGKITPESLDQLVWGITNRSPEPRYVSSPPRWNSRRRLFAGFFMLLVTALFIGFLLREKYSTPSIDSIDPVAPIADGLLKIYGDNFPDDSDRMRVLFDNVEASQIVTTTKKFAEVRVPGNASSGPIWLVKRSKIPILPNLRTEYPVVTVQRLDRDVVLLNERIDVDRVGLGVLFSAVNTTADRTFTIHDIQLNMLMVQDRGSPTYKQERIDLGVVSVFKDINVKLTGIFARNTSLFGDDFVVKLDPRSSESFSFRIQAPRAPVNIHLIFAVSLHVYDDRGRQEIVFADRLYNVMVDDLRGFVPAGDLPLNRETLQSLREKYGEAFRDTSLLSL